MNNMDEAANHNRVSYSSVRTRLEIMRSMISLLLLPIFLLGCFDARAQDSATKIDQYMSALVELHQFSGAVMVAKEGKPIISCGYGIADFDWEIPNRPDTKFRIGSITKQFTSMAIMMLQERGKLDVRDRICKYVSKCPVAWQPITIHQLLTHTSGIPDFTGFPDYEKMKKFPITPADLVDSFKNKSLDFTPGQKFQYSNSGYEVLGLIIEKLAGKSYSAFLKENIFDPLAMKSTGYDSNSDIISQRARGYSRKGGIIHNSDYIDMTVPYAAGGLYSTAEDLLRWDQSLYSEELVTRKSLTAMFTPYVAIVGYGWAIETQFNHKMISHEGGIDGFVSKIARYPDDQITIIVLSNLDTAPITNITKDLAAVVFGEKYELPEGHKFIHLDPSKLSAYIGKYQVVEVPDVVITISVKDDKLVCEVQGQSFVLLPESGSNFASEDSRAQVVFVRDEKGRIAGLTFNGQFNTKKIQ